MAEKQRSTTPHSLENYSFKNYIAYVLYPPLYIAGPIITFNNFLWQVRRSALCSCRAYSRSTDSKTIAHPSFRHPQISLPVPDLPPHNGTHTALYVCCCHQRHSSVGGGERCRVKFDRLVELDNRLAEGMFKSNQSLLIINIPQSFFFRGVSSDYGHLQME